MLVTEAELLALARRSALQHRSDSEYLPQDFQASQAFEPHGWVLQAMRDAIAENDLKRGLMNEFYQAIQDYEVSHADEPTPE